MILEGVILIIGVIFYGLFFYFFTRRNKTPFFITCILLIVLHDYIFINVSFYTSSATTYLLKSWQEYLILFLTILLILKKPPVNKRIALIFCYLIALTIYGFTVSLIASDSLFTTILSWRSYLVPILLPTLIYFNKGFHGVSMQLFNRLLTILLVGIILHAQYQTFKFTYNEGPDLIWLSKGFRTNADRIMGKTLWFYNYFGADYLIPRWFNMVRDGKLRATSIFVSPIIFAQFLGILGTLFVTKLLYEKSIQQRIWISLLITAAFYGIYVTQVRAGLIFVLISLSALFWLLKIPKYRYFILIIPLIIVVITFLSLVVFKVGDESSIGRIVQYKELFEKFRLIGYGLGNESVVLKYDSLIISVLLAFGLMSFLYFKIHTMLIKSLAHSSSRNMILDKHLGIGILSCLSAYLFFAFFHYSIGSVPLRFLYFITFFYIYKK